MHACPYFAAPCTAMMRNPTAAAGMPHHHPAFRATLRDESFGPRRLIFRRIGQVGLGSRCFGGAASAFGKDATLLLSERRNPMLFSALYLIPIVLIAASIVLKASVRILREYERAVVFTLGRFERIKGPGLVLLIPFYQEMVRVDLRIQVIEIPSQDVISRDNVSMKVDAVLYFNVVNPERAIIQVQSYLPATNMLAQTTLRAVLGQHDLDEMLSERKKLSTDVQSILDAQTETWGIKVSNVEIRTVELTENMVRAIAKQAEAERDRRAKIIHAEAEFQASQTLVNAAQILSSIPAAMQLRYLQTLAEIGAEQNSTIVFPMPIDIIKPFLELMEKGGKRTGANGDARVPLPLGAPPRA
jgi:regulator of protease activity HflC (stomatin/prohibitin superfamily)